MNTAVVGGAVPSTGTARTDAPERPERAGNGHHSVRSYLVAIELAPRASAILLTTSVVGETVWTADDRRHDDVPALSLSGVHPLRVRGGLERA